MMENAFKEDEHRPRGAAFHAEASSATGRSINIASDVARVHARLALERKIAAERGISREQVVTLV